MKVYSYDSLSTLSQAAEISPRKRAHLNLHASYDEKVQRLFIALTKGSYVEPHYHELPHQWEMFVVINGLIKVCKYNPEGSLESELLVGDGQEVRVIEFFPGDIHSVECISEHALLLEFKEGPFDPKFSKVEFKFPS
ncbi:WbuC family cupin fold metalloprotein [Vibrio alginolyticus]|uniref:WbuC family cupin fold metalloprotein n=1 Tax=Vibrio alginolyticus TaxID=663 RepID=UPI00216031EC|nr:WbuC family cupin fold metalloprotein [Vibrio alginolyticus]EKY4202493.1 WbuC family cupin fold metalloprotein [Vibrio alginolyticus]ELU8567192.1 WbuC family cupin fold metalloprotein [Vibrio alginolyticus]MCS0136469.1 WbuC family cupin fold metalloprotein [Vibrio alginolyticus]